MRQVEISRLMDEYRDSEFCPEDGSTADAEAVKSRVLAKIKPAAGKRRLSRKKKWLLAAGLAAALVLIGAGFPSVMYRLANSTVTFTQTPDSQCITYEGGSYVKLEDGRLFFVLGDERTDITDQIDENTPYIYDGSDPEAGMTCYLIMGGTPDHYGWLEWTQVPSPFTAEEGEPVAFADENGNITTYYFDSFTCDEQGERYDTGDAGTDALDWACLKDYPWLIAGAKELGLPFVNSKYEMDSVFYAP